MNTTEKKAVRGLAMIYGSRMLGLFLILPVFSLYAEHLPEATPLLTGIALGIYGLSQALLQIPFGLLSDRIGRKPVIIGGLLLFAAGGIIAATATSIYGIIIGRAIQGSGAIAAAIMALLADLTQEKNRTKAMASIGITIGFSFTLALILGPLLNPWIGVPGLFWLTVILALVGIAILIGLVPSPKQQSVHADAEPVPRLFAKVLKQGQLLRLDLSIFILHLVLTALFLALPLELNRAGLAAEQHTWLYLPVMVLAMGLMVPFVIMAEKKQKMKAVLISAILLLLSAQIGFYFMPQQLWLLALLLLLFFIGFNILEATLPSLLSKQAGQAMRGTAMGIYSSAQFSGAFIGGFLGGWVHQHWGLSAVFAMSAAFIGLWLLIAFSIKIPSKKEMV